MIACRKMLIPAFVLSLLLAGFRGGNVFAQPAARVPATVALIEELPAPNAGFLIVRRPNVSPHDVILLPRNGASPRMLSDAVRALLLARRNGGDQPSTSQTLRVRSRDESSHRILPWTTRVMQDLRRADPLPITGIGSVSAVQIWLPPQDAS